jgi:hypothetical protein
MIQKLRNILSVCRTIGKPSTSKRKFLLFYFALLFLAMAIGCNLPVFLTPEPTVLPEPTAFPKPTELPEPTPTLVVPSPTPVTLPLKFHVEGNTFVDQFGKQMVFRGMSAIDPIFQRFNNSSDHSIWSDQYYREMGKWCGNILRLPILPSSLRDYGMEKSLETLDQTIAWAAENNMYVIINFHSLGWPPDN